MGSNVGYDAVQDQGQFGLHLLFCHKNSHWRSLNDYILIKKVKAVLETNGKQFMGSNWQFIWFLFERNGENKSKMVVKKVTKEIQNIICNFCFGCKIDKTSTRGYNDASQILQRLRKEIVKERLWKKDCERKIVKERL